MTSKQTIAVYVPTWLYQFDTGITIFVRGLYRSIKQSKKYRLLKLNSSSCSFVSLDEAKAYVEKNAIVLVIYHDNRVIHPRKAYKKGLEYLESCVPFLNAKESDVANDKLETKRILRTLNIPVLPDVSIRTRAELWREMKEEKLYVGKLHDSGSGRGVKLIKRIHNDFFEYHNRAWRKIHVRDTAQGIELSSDLGLYTFLSMGLCIFTSIFFILNIHSLVALFLVSLAIIELTLYMPNKFDRNFIYNPLMLEPYFGDGTDEFFCLRCTVIGNKVVEAARKTNKKNITPNISHGGKATKVILSKEQEDMAIAATRAVGAVYAGVDLLYAGGKTIVCEVNVGPIGVYCEQTGIDVGKLLGEYAMEYSDKINHPIKHSSL